MQATGTFSDTTQRTTETAAQSRGLRWLLLGSLLVAAILHAIFLAQPWRVDQAVFPMFLGDEGAHGLMALHIQDGARPVFYYGAYYHGAFDAYLSAGLFQAFGSSLATLRLLPTLFGFLCILLAYAVARRMYGAKAAVLAAVLVALPSKYFLEWSTVALCGYCGYAALTLAMAYVVLLLFERITYPRLMVLGIIMGVSIWSNQLSAATAIVCGGALLLWVPLQRRHLIALAIATLVGVAPLIYGNIAEPFATFRQVGRKAMFAWTLSKGSEPAKQENRRKDYHSLPPLQLTGFQPGRDGRFSIPGTIGATLLSFGLLGALWACLRSRTRDPANFRRHALLVALVATILLLGIGGFAGQPLGRYQLPLYPLLSVLAAGWIFRVAPAAATSIVTLVAIANVAAILIPAHGEERTPIESVIEALSEKGLHAGYAAGPMYNLIYRSGESIVLVPLDHPRYPPYRHRVEEAAEIFYVYRTDQQRKLAHQTFVEFLGNEGIRYQKADVGDYHILYDFHPRELITAEAFMKVRKTFREKKFSQ